MVAILFGLPNGIALGQDLTPSQDPVQSDSCASKGEGPNVLDGSTLTPDEVVRLIDREISLGYDKMGVDPAVRCTDEAFIRRVYLDLAGRIPTRDERQEFLSDSSQTKRVDWIDRILASEDYVQHFASVFDTLLMGRTGPGKYAERKNLWRPYLERIFRENRSWDAVSKEILLARPESNQDAGAVWFLFERNDNAQAIAEAVAPSFFGIRIDCAQCHDHMIASEIHQEHYWGLVAFFNRSKNQKTNGGPRLSESAIGGFSEFANIEGSSYPNRLSFFASKTVDEARPEKDAKQEDSDELYTPAKDPNDPRIPKFSRRERFVSEVLVGHPLFAKAFVNRVWAMLMGRGIVHPFDQMDSVHPPSHPDLLDGLARDFEKSGFDIRRLVRAIAASEAYQRSSLRPQGAEDPASFAWYIERPLTAEQVARSLSVALHQKGVFEPPLLNELRERMPKVMPETIVTEVGDALFLSNNPQWNGLLQGAKEGDGLVSKLASNPETFKAIEELFVTVLGRVPDDKEVSAVSAFIRSSGATKGPTLVWRDAAWAVLTSAEFRFNH